MNLSDTASDLQKALQRLSSDTCSPEEKLKVGAAIVMDSHYECYIEVIKALDPLQNLFADNPIWNFSLGFAKTVNGMPEDAVPHLLKTLAHGNNLRVYRSLTWAYLQTDAFSKAILASAAGLHNFPEDAHLMGLSELSKVRAQGTETTSFNYGGAEYTFNLFTSNTQEIEAAITHSHRQLTEGEELQMIHAHVGEVDSVAEIGCLVGNHSVFFLKNLKPDRLTIIDASTTSLEHAKKNVDLNRDPSRPVQINFIHSAVGKHEGTISFLNTTVPVNSLDNLLREPFKFIKIDVDGMEMEVLQGVSNYLETYRPKMMIEVLHSLATPFKEFLKTARYRVIASQDRFNYTNFLIEPSE